MEFRRLHKHSLLDSEIGYGVFPDYSGCEHCYALRRALLPVNVGMGDFWDRILEDNETQGVNVWDPPDGWAGQKEGGWWDRNDSGSSGFDESLSDTENDDVYQEVLCILDQKAQKVRRETVILKQAENSPRVSPSSLYSHSCFHQLLMTYTLHVISTNFWLFFFGALGGGDVLSFRCNMSSNYQVLAPLVNFFIRLNLSFK